MRTTQPALSIPLVRNAPEKCTQPASEKYGEREGSGRRKNIGTIERCRLGVLVHRSLWGQSVCGGRGSDVNQAHSRATRKRSTRNGNHHSKALQDIKLRANDSARVPSRMQDRGLEGVGPMCPTAPERASSSSSRRTPCPIHSLQMKKQADVCCCIRAPRKQRMEEIAGVVGSRTHLHRLRHGCPPSAASRASRRLRTVPPPLALAAESAPLRNTPQ